MAPTPRDVGSSYPSAKVLPLHANWTQVTHQDINNSRVKYFTSQHHRTSLISNNVHFFRQILLNCSKGKCKLKRISDLFPLRNSSTAWLHSILVKGSEASSKDESNAQSRITFIYYGKRNTWSDNRNQKETLKSISVHSARPWRIYFMKEQTGIQTRTTRH
jgi:hypothetical protein